MGTVDEGRDAHPGCLLQQAHQDDDLGRQLQAGSRSSHDRGVIRRGAEKSVRTDSLVRWGSREDRMMALGMMQGSEKRMGWELQQGLA